MMPAYPVRLTPAEEGMVLVTFPDVPEAVSCARGEEAAIERAGEVLEIILGCYESEGRPLPEPSVIEGAPKVVPRRHLR